MQEYDAALKILLQATTGSILQELTGLSITRWLNVEVQQIQAGRVDLLGMTAVGEIMHMELQASNDANMAVRMAEYSLHIYRQFGRFPRQMVLYFGGAKLRMKTRLSGPDPMKPDFAFQYALVDFRQLDGSELLASNHVAENLLAILARLHDQRAAVRQILRRISGLEEGERRDAFAQFLVISGLRRLGEIIKEEAQKMPIMNDILDHDLLGPAILKGRQEGRQEIVRGILQDRFGAIPGWASVNLTNLSESDLQKVASKAFTVFSYEDLFADR